MSKNSFRGTYDRTHWRKAEMESTKRKNQQEIQRTEAKKWKEEKQTNKKNRQVTRCRREKSWESGETLCFPTDLSLRKFQMTGAEKCAQICKVGDQFINIPCWDKFLTWRCWQKSHFQFNRVRSGSFRTRAETDTMNKRMPLRRQANFETKSWKKHVGHGVAGHFWTITYRLAWQAQWPSPWSHASEKHKRLWRMSISPFQTLDISKSGLAKIYIRGWRSTGATFENFACQKHDGVDCADLMKQIALWSIWFFKFVEVVHDRHNISNVVASPVFLSRAIRNI